MGVLEALLARRSVRAYSGETVPAEKLNQVLAAGLASASGRGRQPWELLLVTDKAQLEHLSHARVAGAGMLAGAEAAIVVLGNEHVSDTWIEDCSIAMANMHLAASDLGLGSCWIQGRMREAAEGVSTESYVFDALNVPADQGLRLEAMLSLGMPVAAPQGRELQDLPWEKVHDEEF